MKRCGKQILALAVLVTLVFSLGATALAAGVTDMPAANYWSYTALNAAVTNNLLKGDNNNKLNPEANLKRAEMAAIVNRAFGSVQAADISKFADVSKNAWYYSDIAKAVQMGTFTGYGSDTMKPESSITRQEAFVVLARAIRLANVDTSVLDKYSDNALIADWAKDSLAAMVSAGYIIGTDGKLNPTGTITRQEFAQVVYNTVKSYISTSGTVTAVADGNVMVNVTGVTLKNLTVKGDLIVGDGVANGDFTLDNVIVEGRLVVRGGGKNSIEIINHSSVGNIVFSKSSDGTVRVFADSTSSVEVVYINDGKDGVIVEGNVTTLIIAGSAYVEIRGNIANVLVTAEAKGAEISVASGSTVGKLVTNASNVIVSGAGKITEATVNGDNTAINVVGTKVTVGNGVLGTTVNGIAVISGTDIVVVAPPVIDNGYPVNYKGNIDSALTTVASLVVSSLTGTSADKSTVTFTPTSSGGTISVTYPSSVKAKYTNLGIVSDDIQKYIVNNTNLTQINTFIALVTNNISEIRAGNNDLPFIVTSGFTVNDVKTYLGTLTYTDTSPSTQKISRTSDTSKLPNTYSVKVKAKDNTTYTYTITRSSQ